jgi:hypothetical protein
MGFAGRLLFARINPSSHAPFNRIAIFADTMEIETHDSGE